MKSIKIEVINNIARVTEKPKRITAGTIGLPVEFTFDSHWDGFTKSAVFTAGCRKFFADDIHDTCVVPWEVLQTPGLMLMIGVYGEKKDYTEAIPTVWANIGAIQPGANMSPSPNPSASAPVWQKLRDEMSYVNDMVQAGCISDASVNSEGELVLEFLNGETINVGRVAGENGSCEVFLVHFDNVPELDEDGFATCNPDATNAEIFDAYSNGKMVVGILDDRLMQLTKCDDASSVFTYVTTTMMNNRDRYIYEVEIIGGEDVASVYRTPLGGQSGGASGSGAVVSRFFGKTANFLGDSQTDDAGNYKSVFFYDWLKKILGLSATNSYGYSGTTIMPISGQNKSFLDRYTSMSDDADLIVVWGGTNDYHYGHALGGVDDTAKTTFCGALNNLCKGLITKYPQKSILFVTPTPRGNIASAVATQKEYADAIIAVCAKYCIPVFDAFRKCNMPIITDSARRYTVDGLHLNDLGHEILGKSMANFILYSEMAGAQTAWGGSGGSGGGGDDNGGGEDDNGGSDETEVTLTGITATYSGGDVVVGTALTALTGLVVTATYSDRSTATITGYTLSGSIGEGSNTITVSYSGLTTTFAVTGIAEVEEAPVSPVDGKTVTFTAKASWPAATNLTLLVNASDMPSYGYKDILTVRMTVANATKTISAFGKGMQIFTDETGQLNNSKYKTGFTGYVTSTMDGDVITATAQMEATQPDFAYVKIPVSISASEYPVSFKIVSLTAELNGTYIPIQEVGGFYANEGYSEN